LLKFAKNLLKFAKVR